MTTSSHLPEILPAPQPYHRLPDVLLIGAAKSGTTSLAKRLAQHPAISLARDKEPEFFSHDSNLARGLDWYSEQFRGATEYQLCFDASTGYSRSPQHPNAARRLFHYCPRAKIIYLMRHPVDRAYSHFVHRFTKELFPNQPFNRTFEQHVLEDPICLDSSNYRLQIEKYLEFYPQDAMLLLFTHELASDEVGTVQKVCKFLGINDSSLLITPAVGRKNVSSSFRESRVRIKVTNAIKSRPVIRNLVYKVPSPLRALGYRSLRQIGIGRHFEREYTGSLTFGVGRRVFQGSRSTHLAPY